MDRFREDLDYYCGEIVRQIYHEVNGPVNESAHQNSAKIVIKTAQKVL